MTNVLLLSICWLVTCYPKTISRSVDGLWEMNLNLNKFVRTKMRPKEGTKIYQFPWFKKTRDGWTDRRTDRPTDRPTDRETYRVACTRLTIFFKNPSFGRIFVRTNLFFFLFFFFVFYIFLSSSSFSFSSYSSTSLSSSFSSSSSTSVNLWWPWTHSSVKLSRRQLISFPEERPNR